MPPLNAPEPCMTIEEFRRSLKKDGITSMDNETMLKLKDQMERLADLMFSNWLDTINRSDNP